MFKEVDRAEMLLRRPSSHAQIIILLLSFIFCSNVFAVWSHPKIDLVKCKEGEFECINLKGQQTCMPNWFKCDGRIDCLDFSDEENCIERLINCTDMEFQCAHRKMCIDKRFKCDGNRGDCSDLSDEDGCPACDSTKRLMCFDKQICLPGKMFCDGVADCTYGFDELNCKRDKPTYGQNIGIQCPDNTFKCQNGLQCLPQKYVCDGSRDCGDASDEAQCEQAKICKSNDKICANGICLSEEKFCNGIEDCTDGSDEAHCPIKNLGLKYGECEKDEYKCEETPTICIKLDRLCKTPTARDDCIWRTACRRDLKLCEETDPNCRCRRTYTNTSVCYCPDGFGTVNQKCVDIDECKVDGTCDQICTNLIGTYQCSCHSGYQLYEAKGDGRAKKCRVMGSRPLLLMSNRFEMRQFDLTAKRYHTLASNLSSDAVLDYWHKNQTLFWSDSTNGQIIACKSLRMEDGMLNNLGVCVREGSSGNEKQPNRARFHGIAVDWIHGLAFWTEINPNPSINVYDLSNNYARVIIDTQMDQPKQIVVDPMKGLIFWADLASDSRIERAGMNGQDRLTILKEPQLKRPTALTIDVLQQRLYWADSKLKSIMSADYYGQNIKTILHAHSIIRFPYSMVVFENQIFYSDRDQANILSMNRFDGSDIQILFTRLPGPTSLRIYHEQLQPDQRNLCANLTCSQLCLPMAMLRATLPEKEKNNEVPAFMCLCTAGQKPDPKDPKKCIQAERTVEDLYVETSDLKRRRGFFSTLSIFVMIVMVIGAAYYWYTHRWRPVNSNGFQQFINPAFES